MVIKLYQATLKCYYVKKSTSDTNNGTVYFFNRTTRTVCSMLLEINIKKNYFDKDDATPESLPTSSRIK